MATVKELYSSTSGTGTSITVTLNSLASAGARQSTAVSNTTNLYMDAFVSVTLSTASGSLGTNASVSVYVYALQNDGSGDYTDACTGSDASFTLPAVPNLLLAKVISVNTAASVVYSGPFSIAQVFGGNMPTNWGIVVVNNTGLALASSGCVAQYIGVNQTVA